MSDFHFLRPQFLFLFIPFLLLLILLFRSRRHASIWNKICSKDLMPYILVEKSNGQFLTFSLILVTLASLIFALAGPSWQMIPLPLIKTQSGLVIVLDLSPTMNAEDIKPSRLKRAIFKINDILNLRQEGQTALMVFSGNPFIVTPLTDDASTIKTLLPVLETNLMPSSGHDVHKAISQALDLLTQAGISNGSILLVTAEISKQDMQKSIDIAVQHHTPISVLGIGTEENTPIRKQEGGFITNDKGALVIATLAKENLHTLATSTGGVYATISMDDSDVLNLKNNLALNHLNAQEVSTLSQNQWHDQGYLLVLLALPFASLIFRRGILVLALFLMPQALQAFSWVDLWKSPDQQAQQLFYEEKYEEAKALFQNTDWQAASHYKLGDYETAASLYQNDNSADGFFNFGTAKAKQGDFKTALEAYNKTLEIQPGHEDALYNKKLIEDLQKKNQQDKQKNQGKNSDKNSNDPKDDQNQDQDQTDSQEKNQDQKSDQNQKDQEQSSDQNEQQDNKQNDSQDESDKQNDTAENNENDEKKAEELEDQYRNQVEKEMQEDKEQPQQPEAQPAQEDLTSLNEQQRQIDDRWLQRIKDDPGGLLRRKFLQQYRQQNRNKTP